jgi:Periplasmic copper-binding protein (NosD)
MSQKTIRAFPVRALFFLACAPLLLLWLTTPTGCFLYRDDSLYCADQPNNTCVAAPLACTSNEQCLAPTGVCDLDGSQSCVQCTPSQASACVGAAPVCGSDHACRACSAHSDCASAACLPDGACGSDVNVAYVDPAGTGTACSKAAPCKSVDDALKTTRPYVKFSGVTDEAVTVAGKTVTFLADPGAKLTRGAGGAIITVSDTGTSLNIYDLTISDAPNNANGYGVLVPTGAGAPSVSLTRVTLQNNPGGGISASGGALTVTQSTISGNTGGGISASGGALTVTQSTISGNTGGGISVANASFDITNTFFFGNGGVGATVGGIAISTTQNAANRLEFNSFNRNAAQDTIGAGIQCVAGTFTARNNVVYLNGTVSNLLQIAGSCSHAYSDIGPTGTVTGTNNINVDPMFLNPATGDLHLSPTSPVRGMADPTTDLTGPAAKDIDGQPRVQPSDLGADEIP